MSGNPDNFGMLWQQIFGSSSRPGFKRKNRRNLDIDKYLWDERFFWRRTDHFFCVASPRNFFHSSATLERSRGIVRRYRQGEDFTELSDDEIWHAKSVYDSAFHPVTSEKLFILARVCAQVPLDIITVISILSLHHSPYTSRLIVSNGLNQELNTIFNYSNRNGTTHSTRNEMVTAHLTAITVALAVTLGVTKLLRNATSTLARFAPFLSISAAHVVNVPISRMKELKDGVTLFNEEGKEFGISRMAAGIGIFDTILSRIFTVAPALILTPMTLWKMEKRGILKRYPYISLPTQLLICGLTLSFSVPVGYALFPQNVSIAVTSLESSVQNKINKMPEAPQILYYSKGL